MITTSAEFKTAIRAPARRIKARLVLSDITINQVDSIELDSILSDEDDLIIGTANMDVMKIEISDDPLSPLLYAFDGKEIDVQLGIYLLDGTYEYHSLGKFFVEKSERKDSKIYLELIDRMYKASKPYINNLVYPVTLKQILTSAATQAGITLEPGGFINQGYAVNIEPVYEGITCRDIFSGVAELAGGYARINRAGNLEIKMLGTSEVETIDGNHYFDWKISESAPGVIDKVIVKSGVEQATAGPGINIYTIVDNLFVQNPADVADGIYGVLSGINYLAGKLNWIGDFSLDPGDKILIDGSPVYIINRKLKYGGGLKENVTCPGKSNVEKNSTGKPNTSLLINRIRTELRIQDGKIDQKISDDVGKFTEINQSIDGISETVANKASQAQVNQLADEISSKVTQQDVENLIDNINRANPNLVTNLSENWEQGDINNSTGTLVASLSRIRTKAYFPIRQGYVTLKVAPLYEAMIVLYNSSYGFKASYGFANLHTFLLDENSYFKMVLRRANASEVTPAAINTAELKVENAQEATQFTPYFGDLTLDQQQEYYQLDVESNNGWVVDGDDYTTTLTARVYLFNEVVTSRFEAYQFTWYKQYPDGILISLGNGTTKTITGTSLEKSATLSCAFEIYDTVYLLAAYNGDTLLTMSNDNIMIIGDYQ